MQASPIRGGEMHGASIGGGVVDTGHHATRDAHPLPPSFGGGRAGFDEPVVVDFFALMASSLHTGHHADS